MTKSTTIGRNYDGLNTAMNNEKVEQVRQVKYVGNTMTEAERYTLPLT